MKIKDIDIKTNLLNIGKYVLAIFLVLLYWELLIYNNLYLSFNEFTIFNVLFLIPIAIVLTAFVGFKDKFNSINLILIIFIVSLFYLCNLIYFETFGSIPSISMIGAGTDAITNFWWSVATTLKNNIFKIILFELPVILLIIEAIFIKKISKTYVLILHPINLLIGIALWFIVILSLGLGGKEDYTPYGAYHSRYIDTDTASKKLGVLPNAIIETRYAVFGTNKEQMIEIEPVVEEEIIEEPEPVVIEYNEYKDLDFNALSEQTGNRSVLNIYDYLNTLSPTKKNDYTGLFKNKNLIYICAESFSSLAIDPVITPTLYKMANHGIVLKNYYNAFRNVTTNGEYALLTGLWPDIAREETNMGALTGTMGQSIYKNMSQSLGNMFDTLNIQARGYHNYYGYYYGRNQTLPNMGFDCKFMNDGMTFTTSWPASDLEMMQQSIKDYINDRQFCTYYMTFSGHGDYSDINLICAKNYDYVKEKVADKEYCDNAVGYLACNYELELAMEYLLNELEAANKLDDTVIVLAGDHYPYYLTDEAYQQLSGQKRTYSFDDYRSTCIIYNSEIDTIIVNEPCCNVDILPTILNLFDINYDSRLYAGNDIFSDSTHVATLYNKSFLTDKVRYNSANGNREWLVDVSNKTDEELDKYIDSMYSYVKQKYAYSSKVEETDFYSYLFD